MPFMQRSIQWQLIVSMGAALLASILIVILVYSSAVNRLAERYLVGQALPANISAIRNDIERTLAAPITATAGIAGNTLVQDWLQYGESTDQAQAMGRYLEGVKAQQNALTTSIAVLDSGNYYSEAGLSRTLNRNAPGDGWFYSLIDSGTKRRFEIDIDKASRQPTLFINQRIEAGGRTLGVAGLGFSLKSMSELISNFRFGERGEVYLISGGGRVKVHPKTENNDQIELAALTGSEAAQKLLDGATDAVRFERDGEAFLAVAQPLESLGWVLVSEVPEAEIFAEARRTLWTISLIGACIALFFLGLVVLLARGLVKPIRQVTNALVEIGGGGGDLTRRLDESRADELGDLARGFNRFIGSLRGLIGDVLSTSEQLRSSVGQVAQVVDNTATRAGRQHEMTDMVATAVHEMGLTVQEIARNASNAAQASQGARSEAITARKVVGDSIAHIEKMSGDIGHAAESVTDLAQQVASIDKVLAVIRSISEQTNLLALNAAIEAARAGEMGRGFAVVADEVRTLASRTQTSTDEIQQMIQGLKSGAENAVNSMHAGQAATGTGVQASQRTGQSLSAITEQVEAISDMNTQVAAATEEQSSVTEEITRNVQGIADLAQATASDVQGCREDCHELSRLADDLSRQMGSFKL
ncbi:MAG: chemotaxis protein [Pseudomonas sp.]|jgi:methyl-accepting chemotaxis protein|nr:MULTISPECIES: methyl-accepting chemotaxis protein [Pseudomonadaceae]MAX90555.1 chemotaxis protein [Pseudomonas sp.]MBU0809991.1 methyl-accepting chemotaxis protein [Gammaproteobacteria bacterium]MBK3846836.1 HAMP domain-containing protein [Stutzerimonas xanthomarina]MBU0850972.1 methyl-accepting chemotaxis protein [Gammaproteobacteria bacterium]MBU1300714.1 methyl-accepting chemotaxis protein [Gammaproteobacteria bacterium]|tara:strand:- start:19410 stop:21341 length:1932 start_codon:yes stop_codon:yes gene_type:complete